MSSAAILLSPTQLPTRRDKATYQAWRDQVQMVIEFRGGYRKLKTLERGGQLGYLANRGSNHEFDLGTFPVSDEIHKLLSLSQSFSGEYLVIWTCGQSLTTLLITAPGDGTRPDVHECSFRLTRLGNLPRYSAYLTDMQSWFADSVFSPDFDTLTELYHASRISVPAWFEAFGVAGAREVEDTNTDALWADFERVATTILRSEKVSVKDIRALNQQITAYDEEARLPTKPLKYPQRTNDCLLDAFYALEEVIGEPTTPTWQARLKASIRYSDLIDCSEIWERMTTYSSSLPKLGGLQRVFVYEKSYP